MAKAHPNGVWKWALTILMLLLVPAVGGGLWTHEQRITRAETTIKIRLDAQAELLAKIDEKLDRFIERTSP